MTPDMIINILQIVSYVVLGGLVLYFKTNTKLKSFANNYIAEAEKVYKDVTKAGGTKMNYVIDKLYELVPTYMKPFFPRELVHAIVQNAFDKIEDYTKLSLDRATDYIVDKIEDVLDDDTDKVEKTIDDVVPVTPYD